QVAIAGINRIPYTGYHQLQQVFSVDEFASADDLFVDLRKVKSAAEIEVIRYAYYIAEKGTEAAVAALEVGKTEREVAAEAEQVMRSLGSEGMGIDTMVRSEEHTSELQSRFDLVCRLLLVKKKDFIYKKSAS